MAEAKSCAVVINSKTVLRVSFGRDSRFIFWEAAPESVSSKSRKAHATGNSSVMVRNKRRNVTRGIAAESYSRFFHEYQNPTRKESFFEVDG